MKKELVLKIGPTAVDMHIKLTQILRDVRDSSDVYPSNTFLYNVGVRTQDWDLSDTDDCFACMPKEDFAKLRPTDLDPERVLPIASYEDVTYPECDPPYDNVFRLERCAHGIANFFGELEIAKASLDGHGIDWPENLDRWGPRRLAECEDYLRDGRRTPPFVPYGLRRAYYNDDKPHQLYHAWHGDEGKDGVVLRSEIVIFLRCMKRRFVSSTLCMHNIPVLLLSIHGAKARIMIARFNLDTKTLDVKCSKFEQFDGFEAREGARSRDGRVRPRDFEAKRDLFFRWLNPICQGNTFLEDSKDAEMVVRGTRGRRRLVTRSLLLPKSSSSVLRKTVE